ncbi:hypothetical protein N657DRAFT_650588 [Parathielavia appendiculata]|uniref:Uncharacterized protein n=1 Tax=Parathielavia appendiculata TaxID=2587402 RepID=A0AAN6Z029_9PEZI|nr:hypothetical protein N657DRAFT_650588 [Parathielavia appendiculata]
MSHPLAAVLGDPKFPKVTTLFRNLTTSRETSHGERISYFEDLHRPNSRLAFMERADLLEQRLSTASRLGAVSASWPTSA